MAKKYTDINNFFENILPKLQKNPLDDKTLVFIGAGLSRKYGCSSWADLAKNVINICHKNGMNYITSEELLATENSYKTMLTIGKKFLENRQKSNTFVECLKESLNDDDDKVNQSHQGVYQHLKSIFRYFITTNADRHIDNFFDKEKVHFNYMPKDFLEENTLYKIHGSIVDYDSMVLTVSEYLSKYRISLNGEEYSLGDFLQLVFSSYNVIFIGYGLSEFELLNNLIARSGKDHYIVKGYFSHQKDLIEAYDPYFNLFNVQQVVYYLDEKGHGTLIEEIEKYYNTKQSENNKPLEKFAKIDEALGGNHRNIIKEAIDIILSNQEYQEYFFSNLQKMKHLKQWLEPLSAAELLVPENQSAIVYIRLLLQQQDIHNNQTVLNIATAWLDYFNRIETVNINSAMWLIEQIVKLDNSDIQKKCKLFILNKFRNIAYACEMLNILDYSNEFSENIYKDDEFIFELTTIIIAQDMFDILGKNMFFLLDLRKKLSKHLMHNRKSEYVELIINKTLLPYLKANQNEFVMIDTIDYVRSMFTYANYLIGCLIDLIAENNEQENKKLIEILHRYMLHNDLDYLDKAFIFKIIIYIIAKIQCYELIMCVINEIIFLEELSFITYALYHCIIKNNIETWYSLCPNFEEWLSQLEYSTCYKDNYSDPSKLKLWSQTTKLTLLYPFQEISSLYKELKPHYPYPVSEVSRHFEIKTSWESKNDYIEKLKKATIEGCVKYLNNPELFLVQDSFSEIHIEEAFQQDFRLDNNKYRTYALTSTMVI